MRRIMDFIALDFMSMKPYMTVKNLVIMTALAISGIWFIGSVSGSMSMVSGFILMYTAYPFAIGEQNGIDTFYTVLGYSRDTVVYGRYGFLAVTDVVLFGGMFLIVSIFCKLFSIMTINMEEVFSALAILYAISLFQLVQLPVMFRYGYLKARDVLRIYLFALTGILFLSFQLFRSNASAPAKAWIVQNPVGLVGLLIVVWIAAAGCSLAVSKRVYRRRAF